MTEIETYYKSKNFEKDRTYQKEHFSKTELCSEI